jgi:hypothetical protein
MSMAMMLFTFLLTNVRIRYPKILQDSNVGQALKKWPKKIKDAKRHIFIADCVTGQS